VFNGWTLRVNEPQSSGTAERTAERDPLGATRIAKAIPNARGEGFYYAATAMITVAWTAAGTDKTLGRSLFDDAERLANSITTEHGKKAALDLLHKWKTHRGL
jgi:phage gpG-like protein